MPVAYDSLVRGHRNLVKWGPLEIGDIRSAERLDEVIARHRPVACVHLAAFAYVGESVREPLKYYDNNVVGSVTLLQSLLRGGVRKFLFSSTCAVYGVPAVTPITEDAEKAPINPYGHTKLAIEWILDGIANSTDFRYGVMRYFNAAGADPDGEIGERHDPEPHLIPSVIESISTGRPVLVFGRDYPTPDGTCIRDYIHVTDLADAHVRALRAVMNGDENFTVNLGTGQGHSVHAIIEATAALLGKEAQVKFVARRPGDPPSLVARAELASRRLGWAPRYSDLNTILRTAIDWYRRERS